MTNLLYGSSYLYRFANGSSWLGVADDPMCWVVLTSPSSSNLVTFWFESDSGAADGSNVDIGDTVYLATSSTPYASGTRYLGTDDRGYARLDVVGGPIKAKWQLGSSSIAAGQPIPLYAPVTILSGESDYMGGLAAASDTPYVQVGQPATFTSEDS